MDRSRLRSIVVGALIAGVSVGAFAFDQPEVKYYVQRRSGGEMADCRVAAAALGEWAFVTLSDGSKVEATASPLDPEGRSSLRVKIVSAERVTLHEFNGHAKLAQSTPQFTWSASRTWPMHGISIVVESAALLATTRGKPSWREFDPRNPGSRKPRPVQDWGCEAERVASLSR